MGSILYWVVVGGIAGAIGKLIMPGKDPGGIIVTILLGIAGAVVTGFLGKLTGWYDIGEGPGIFAAIIGSVILLFGYRQIKGRQGGGPTL
jgi:uncharacterized membrane protein YeaQ/YmgE (transglycosylase-associated protein family)